MSAIKAAIVQMIEEVVRQRFADALIHDVRVSQEHDSDGDALFRVTVVFERKGAQLLDAHKTAGIARHIRHRLLEEDEDAFPIVTFVSKSDAAGLEAAHA
jgi:hypothetical protein